MKVLFSMACAATFIGLVGCGGGGSGGEGEGGMPITPAPALTTAVSTTAPPLATTVTVNGTYAVADATGRFAAKTGDTVEIRPSQNAVWTSTASEGAAITLRNPSATSTKWTAQIINGSTDAATYTVLAQSATDETLTTTTVLNIAGGDARNGVYRVYATNAMQYQLTLDFDANVYTFVAEKGMEPVSGTFSADASEPGTYVFKSDKITTAVNTARFRIANDTVVGAFPFIDPLAASPTYVVKAFIAVRKMVTKAAELDGLYNRLGIQSGSATNTSQITQTEISAGGTIYKRCASKDIRNIANCPSASLLTYNVTPTEVAGVWFVTNVADSADNGRFAMARVGDQNVYLAAGISTPSSGQYVFRIGMRDTPIWASATGYGASTQGSWGSIALTPPRNTRNAIGADGLTVTVANIHYEMGSTRPAGMRQIAGSEGAVYFGIYNTKLLSIVGASNATTGGYLELTLLD